MDRRAFLGALAGGLLAAPLAGKAQEAAAGPPLIGVLMFLPLTKAAREEFRQGLRDHGYVERQNIVVEWRSAEGKTDRIDALAAELVRLKVAVIIAELTPAARAAKNATHTIPIVMASAGDPLAMGLVASLARPEGNVTGFTNMAAELSEKRLELLREVIPGLKRVGLLLHGADPLDGAFIERTRTAAAAGGIQLHVGRVSRPEELEPVVSAMAKERVGAVIVLANLPVPVRQAAQLALRYRLPSISLLNEFVETGGLMSYGASVSDIRRRTGSYVDRILKGAKPGDLPVEQPTKFELVINLKTAKALGLTIPPALLQRADQVIE